MKSAADVFHFSASVRTLEHGAQVTMTPTPEKTTLDAAVVNFPSVNESIAANLTEFADLLEQQGADGFRVGAYRRAAAALVSSVTPIDEVYEADGLDGLIALPAIGKSIASAIAEMVSTGRWVQLERLRGSLDPEKLFQTIPGIGPDLAARIHDELHVDTLEALETAAHSGQLERVSGIGRRRALIVQAVLSERLGRRRFRNASRSEPPGVDVLLDVDREYREGAISGVLRRIAPKRFNPSGEAWLPILHTRRDDWIFTVLYSNTRRANELHRTHDWVVVFFHTDNQPEGQCTVVTETSGTLKGKRVVRGREDECGDFYSEDRQ